MSQVLLGKKHRINNKQLTNDNYINMKTKGFKNLLMHPLNLVFPTALKYFLFLPRELYPGPFRRQRAFWPDPQGMTKRLLPQDVCCEDDYLQDQLEQVGDVWLKDEQLL